MLFRVNKFDYMLTSVVNLKHTSIHFKRNEFDNFRTKEYIKL